MRCESCGVTSYAPLNGSGVSCPECGVPVARGGAGGETDSNRRLEQLMRMTRELLDTDVALLTQITGGREIARRAAGDWPALGSLENASLPVKDTFCNRMLDGRIGNYIRDARTDERVSDLEMARQLGIGAWLGVPIRISDTELYVLCCLARESRPSLGEREVRMLAGLAESVRVELEAR